MPMRTLANENQLFQKRKTNDYDVKDPLGVNSTELNLIETDLYGADIFETDLRGADIFETDLRGADIFETDLRGADIFETDLRWADILATELWGLD